VTLCVLVTLFSVGMLNPRINCISWSYYSAFQAASPSLSAAPFRNAVRAIGELGLDILSRNPPRPPFCAREPAVREVALHPTLMSIHLDRGATKAIPHEIQSLVASLVLSPHHHQLPIRIDTVVVVLS
jgi:hypothetical protein